jgi:hypothetical protein
MLVTCSTFSRYVAVVVCDDTIIPYSTYTMISNFVEKTIPKESPHEAAIVDGLWVPYKVWCYKMWPPPGGQDGKITD